MEQISHHKPPTSSIHLKKRLAIILEKKWRILAFVLGGALLAGLISFIMPKQYRATSIINFNYSSINNSLLSKSGSLDNEIALVKSDEMLNSAKQSLGTSGVNVSIQDLLKSIDIKEDKNSTSIIISAFSNEAKKTAQIANTVSQNIYQECLISDRSSYIFMLKSLVDRDKQLQEKIRTDGSAPPISSLTRLSSADDKIVTEIAEFESELEGVEIDNQFYQMKLDLLQKILNDKFPQISTDISIINDTPFFELKQKIERSEVQNYLSSPLQKLRGFTISYPWGKELDPKQFETYKSAFYSHLKSIVKNISEKNNISDTGFLEKLVNKYYEAQIKVNAIDQTKSVIFNTMTSLEDKFNQIPFTSLDYAREVRAKRFSNNLALKIKSKLIRVRETESNYLAETSSIQLADVPGSFVSPNIILNVLLGILAGLLIGLGTSLLSKGKDLDIVNSAEEIEEAGYKIIAQIPHYSSLSPMLFDSEKRDEDEEINRKIVHSFENIQTYLKYGNLDKPLKTILVTSGFNEEGKSTIAANIAWHLSNSDSKVLLVDADLKKPELNKIFKVNATPSLAHYLFRKKELDEIVRKTDNANLDLITCIEFPQNPAVIVTSERMKNFMDTVKEQYDYVIYDSSSLCQLKETSFIAANVDETILVVRKNQSKFIEIAQAESFLSENNIFTFDIVLNDV